MVNDNSNSNSRGYRLEIIRQVLTGIASGQGGVFNPDDLDRHAVNLLPRFAAVPDDDLEEMLTMGQRNLLTKPDDFVRLWLGSRQAQRVLDALKPPISPIG